MADLALDWQTVIISIINIQLNVSDTFTLTRPLISLISLISTSTFHILSQGQNHISTCLPNRLYFRLLSVRRDGQTWSYALCITLYFLFASFYFFIIQHLSAQFGRCREKRGVKKGDTNNAWSMICDLLKCYPKLSLRISLNCVVSASLRP